ncbi:MAG TPA: 5-(carboxyamino)imidazole ribonucleotide synthase [Abditibacteriaceae bacterium]
MTIGILGGGQLGRMLALSGIPLGLQFRFLDPSPDAPAAQLGTHIAEDFNDPEALQRFVPGLDVVTYEFENVPVASARFLTERVPVYPPVEALEVAQDRLTEKSYFQKLDVPTPRFAAVNSREELDDAVAQLGLPAVLKTRRFGYDGKGQMVLRESKDVASAWQSLGGVPLILEEFVPFEREVSILAVRARDGATAFYPLVENHHRAGILRLSLAPAPNLTPELQTLAEEHARRLLQSLDYVGVLAIEFFQCGQTLIVNEFAPRVHNSGHWTIEGAVTSQFENHMRAVCGLPLGETRALGHCAMHNIIGTLPDASRVLATPGAHLHLYGKQPKPGRKLGHISLCEQDESSLGRRNEEVAACITT